MRTITIPMEIEDINYIERLFVDYQSRKDLISTMFEMHKFDEDEGFVTSKPFEHYQKQFMESKVVYDEAMKMIEHRYVPEEVNKTSTRFEVDFTDQVMKVYVRED